MTPDTPTRSKKRPLEIHEERSLEQRQKRMIKNRESAARSRARKQAYTVELEAQVTELKEENAKLKQEQIEARKKRRKWLDATLVPVTSQPQRPVRVLRRTQTCFWWKASHFCTPGLANSIPSIIIKCCNLGAFKTETHNQNRGTLYQYFKGCVHFLKLKSKS